MGFKMPKRKIVDPGITVAWGRAFEESIAENWDTYWAENDKKWAGIAVDYVEGKTTDEMTIAYLIAQYRNLRALMLWDEEMDHQNWG